MCIVLFIFAWEASFFVLYLPSYLSVCRCPVSAMLPHVYLSRYSSVFKGLSSTVVSYSGVKLKMSCMSFCLSLWVINYNNIASNLLYGILSKYLPGLSVFRALSKNNPLTSLWSVWGSLLIYSGT
jgi:hypothetical protein